MDAFLISTGLVALAEIGDKTQLLAFVLAARFKRPVPIVAGIFVATLVNHAMAASLGAWLMSVVGPDILRWALGVSFIAMALWTLVPDKLDENDTKLVSGAGVFMATTLAFFAAEMGDKTQIATVALAARYHAMLSVLAGTTLGMMIANVPAVLVGGRLAQRLPVRWMHRIAALAFAALGVAALGPVNA
ncbi:MAG TPA: TMEM165/GDT1 family protein [Albitalea sp.]|uniref:TMEM165/GDT1 family protein n=1 Tax=Piscinibacter sp. TaxID=1903157 RepID=UPI002ED0AA55